MYRQARTTPGGEPIPENYSGNAFRYPPIGSLSEISAQEEKPWETTDTHEEQAPPLSVVPIRQKEREEGEDHHGSGGLLHLLGHEEWLLLGLCLLLLGEGGPRFGGEEDKNNLLPYLLLLLFWG